MIKSILYLFSILVFQISVRSQTDLFGYDNSKKYADYLLQTHQFDLAIPEFERLVFFDAQDSTHSKNLIYCYYKTSQYSRLMGHCDSLMFCKMDYASQLIYMKTCLLDNRFQALEQLLSSDLITQKDKQFFGEASLLLSDRWDETSNLNEPFQLQGVKYSVIKFKEKKHGTAVAMSVFVPGLGKAYAGYWKDGVMSFLFTTISYWQAYRGFDVKGVDSLYGWLFAGIGTSFYLGNLYGSAKAAHKYNHDFKRRVKDETKSIVRTY